MNELLVRIWELIVAQGILQWMAFFFSVLYVIFAAKEEKICWLFGIISVVLYFFIYVAPEVRLYSDALLQVFYFGMSIYGWVNWNRMQESEEVISITRWNWKDHLVAILIGLAGLFLLGWFWSFMNAALPYVDAMTTSFSIIATYMVVKKILENWLYWIVIDAVCIVVYLHRELHLTAFLFLIYLIIAIYGYYRWQSKLSRQNINPIDK